MGVKALLAPPQLVNWMARAARRQPLGWGSQSGWVKGYANPLKHLFMGSLTKHPQLQAVLWLQPTATSRQQEAEKSSLPASTGETKGAQPRCRHSCRQRR